MLGPALAQEKTPTLLDYKDQLGLSAEQVKTIQKAVSDFQGEARELTNQITAAQSQVNNDLDKKADLTVVRTHLEALYAVRCKLQFADLVVGRKIEDTLSADQLKKWRAMQAQSQQRSKP